MIGGLEGRGTGCDPSQGGRIPWSESGDVRVFMPPVSPEYAATRNPALAAALDDPDTAFVLLSRNGRQLAPGAIAKQLKRRANTAGLYVLDPAHGEKRNLVSPHAIRRSIATELLNDGVPLDAVADLLAHEHVDTTRRHYAFASDARRRATIDAILRHDAA